MSEPSPRRARILRKLRNIHGWLGLWGAAMGLCFGFTGILMNHRNILKLPVTLMEKSTVQLLVPAAAQLSPDAMAQWLQAEHAAPALLPVRIKALPPETVMFDGRALALPARWTLSFHEPKRQFTAEYWQGAGMVQLEKQDSGVLGTLTRLHKGYGVDVLWVLLVDSFAGALILLALSGLVLWSKLETPRLAGVMVASTVISLAALWYVLFGSA